MPIKHQTFLHFHVTDDSLLCKPLIIFAGLTFQLNVPTSI